MCLWANCLCIRVFSVSGHSCNVERWVTLICSKLNTHTHTPPRSPPVLLDHRSFDMHRHVWKRVIRLTLVPSVGRQKKTNWTTEAGHLASRFYRVLITGLLIKLRLIVWQQCKYHVFALTIHSRAIAIECCFIDVLSKRLHCLHLSFFLTAQTPALLMQHLHWA